MADPRDQDTCAIRTYAQVADILARRGISRITGARVRQIEMEIFAKLARDDVLRQFAAERE